MVRRALVTGGSRGIGAAIARRLARDGVDVAITHVNAVDRAQAVQAEIEKTGRRALAIKADAADPGEVAWAVNRAAEEFGTLDVLVNNAGVFPQGPFEEVDREELDRTLAIHAGSAFLAAQAAVRHMGRGGSIVNIGSSLAERVPYPGVALYAMSKSALTGLTKALARELGPRGITVNLVHPGSTDTDMNPADSEWADDERSLTALGRYSTPEEIAAAVAHLTGDGGRNITGTAITVDGGANA